MTLFGKIDPYCAPYDIMKKTVPIVLLVAAGSFFGACRSPIIEDKGSDQTRFEQEQAGYPDRLSSQQEAEAAERARKDDMLRKP